MEISVILSKGVTGESSHTTTGERREERTSMAEVLSVTIGK